MKIILSLQWGTTKYGGKGHEQHNYPIAFPNAVFSITGALSDGGSGGANWSVGLVNNTTYYIFTDESSLLSWMAVGY
ncbi:gp53-like domain-containing protein [Mitsuokella multacida]|uniref:gp53-like domain-containing protein n=1 Tax=Mitsuokella multacida TaxID=52226 RepID=UPI00404668F0